MLVPLCDLPLIMLCLVVFLQAAAASNAKYKAVAEMHAKQLKQHKSKVLVAFLVLCG